MRNLHVMFLCILVLLFIPSACTSPAKTPTPSPTVTDAASAIPSLTPADSPSASSSTASPSAATDAPVDPALINDAKKFVSLLGKKDYKTAHKSFDPTMKRSLTIDRLREIWEGFTKQYGKFTKTGKIRTEIVKQYVVIIVPAEFEKGFATDVRIVMNPSTNQIAGLFFGLPKSTSQLVPPYADKKAFTEEEVVVGKGTQWELPGTLSIPNGTGPFPVVVLVHGSGPNDRDETVGGAKPFRDIAWGLASQGIAVLRYDKRTNVHAMKMATEKVITLDEEVIDDALAAVSLLKTEPRIDSKHIFVLGHSLGGITAPRIAVRDKDIAGIILMAATVRPIEEVLKDQIEYVINVDGKVTPEEKAFFDNILVGVQILKNPRETKKNRNRKMMGVPLYYWSELRNLRPDKEVKNLTIPVLIMQGGKDYQAKTADFNLFKKELQGKPNVEFKLYPTLHHLFIESKSPGLATPQEYVNPGIVNREVVDDIAAWVKKNS